jgi:transcription antitermination factor NusG
MLYKHGQYKHQEPSKSWYVLYTKPRHEKKLAERLQSEGWTVYCPLKKTIKQWSDRRKVVEEALFPSFIFIQCEEAQRDQVFFHASAVRYLYWRRKPAIVREDEIQSIKQWMGEVNHEDIAIESIPLGSRVRLSSGPLMGETGTVKELRGTQATIVLEQLSIQVRINAQQTPLLAI